MTRRIKLFAIIISVALVSMLAMGVGFTAAIWTSSGGGSDSNTVAPAADSPFDWNVWAKYFAEDAVILDETNLTAAVTAFHTDEYSLNLGTVIIPSYVKKDGVSYKVTEVTNQVFSDATLRELAVTLYIPPTVEYIDTYAFANLPNLETVVFGTDSKGEGAECVIGDFAFMMCEKLQNIIAEGGRAVKNSDGEIISAADFIGCSDSLTVVMR